MTIERKPVASSTRLGGKWHLPNAEHPVRLYQDGTVEDDLLMGDPPPRTKEQVQRIVAGLNKS